MEDGWIQTYTGRKFFPLAPRAEDVDLRDIAHALAMKCRFNGHCRVFYSVAEHSVRVSRAMRTERAMWGLMHDAAEAYLADIGAPIKRAFHVHHEGVAESFDAVENRLLGLIAQALKFAPVDYGAVRAADLTLLATEARDLLGAAPESWGLKQKPLAERIVPLSPAEAEAAFLARFAELV